MRLLDPDNWLRPVTRDNYWEWRQHLKYELLKKRGYVSDFSGRPIRDWTGCHLHEGILTRANAPKNLPFFYKIFHEVNCLLLLPDEHIPSPPNREWCIEWAYEKYGRDIVRDWFYSIPYKKVPFELP